jgi:hypothetical protein
MSKLETWRSLKLKEKLAIIALILIIIAVFAVLVMTWGVYALPSGT